MQCTTLATQSMKGSDAVFNALERSAFRRKFKLGPADQAYLRSRGMEAVLAHAVDIIAKRLAPTLPPNDGRQTPFRGHPVFVAQHATATCCRSCLAKWHGIPRNRLLDEDEQRYIVAVLERWLRPYGAMAVPEKSRAQLRLF